MTTLREAAQRALEAFEEIADEVFSPYDNKLGDAILALRATLAQQAEPRNQCGETCERAKLCATCARAMPQQAEPVAADALTEPKSGDKWRVEWWNESCRMMLPAHAKLNSFVAYKNGTIQFTIKRTAA